MNVCNKDWKVLDIATHPRTNTMGVPGGVSRTAGRSSLVTKVSLLLRSSSTRCCRSCSLEALRR